MFFRSAAIRFSMCSSRSVGPVSSVHFDPISLNFGPLLENVTFLSSSELSVGRGSTMVDLAPLRV